MRAAVLAGGRGRRLGEPKALALLRGRPLIEWALQAARDAGLEPFVVAKASTALPDGVAEPVLLEPAEPSHPLAGLVRALEQGEAVVALACDDPFVTADELRELAHATGTAVFGEDPLPGRFEPAALPALRAALAREASFREAIAELAPLRLPARGGPGSVNTPEQLAAARDLLA